MNSLLEFLYFRRRSPLKVSEDVFISGDLWIVYNRSQYFLVEDWPRPTITVHTYIPVTEIPCRSDSLYVLKTDLRLNNQFRFVKPLFYFKQRLPVQRLVMSYSQILDFIFMYSNFENNFTSKFNITLNISGRHDAVKNSETYVVKLIKW